MSASNRSSFVEETSSKRFCVRVSIPNVGDVDLAQGHVSFIKSILGVDQACFGTVDDLRNLVVQGTQRALRGRLGSEIQSLAFFQRLDDEVNLTCRVDADYSTFAGVWYKYCCDRYFIDGDMTKGLVPYGKTVARDIFIGKAIQEKNWKKNFRPYPLHNVPCDVCAFLTSLVKTSTDVDRSPYRTLDLKDIHVYFREKLRNMRTDLILTTACPDNDHSDDCKVSSDSEDDLPLSTFVKKRVSSDRSQQGGGLPAVSNKMLGEGTTVNRANVANVPLVLDSPPRRRKGGGRFTSYTPGEIAWE